MARTSSSTWSNTKRRHITRPPSLTLTTQNDIRLLQNKPGELIHIMDDQARRSLKKMVHTMTEVFIKRGGNHLSFKFGAMDRSGYATFKYG